MRWGSGYLLNSGLSRLLNWCAAHKLAQLDERELYHKLLIARLAVLQIASVAQVHSHVEKAAIEVCCCLDVALSDVVVHLKQSHSLWRTGNHQVAQVLS